jgi:putative Mg2+ transporter-C (MgtC) family protein
MNEYLTEDVWRVLYALVAGACLGFEREFHDKPAGFRTLTLICMGSAVFTIISHHYFLQDRVASNIVTGIGFLGAGVMLKEGLTIKGITTASTIWVTAAIGMTIGVGAYWLATVVLALVLSTLVILNRFERGLQDFSQKRTYEITFRSQSHVIEQLENQFTQNQITFTRAQLRKVDNKIVVRYRVKAGRKQHTRLSLLLADSDLVEGFDV